jgi:hypothetical protein
MGNRTTKPSLEMIPKELWKDIFNYLDGEDLLRCSLVCKLFYELNKNNILWLEKIQRKKLYLLQKVSKKHPIFCYYPEINYKQYYLSLFHHSYEFGLLSPYRNLSSDYQYYVIEGTKKDYWKNLLRFYFLYVPAQILMFPVYGIVEIIEYIQVKKREKKYCDCRKCHWKQQMVLSKLKNK